MLPMKVYTQTHVKTSQQNTRNVDLFNDLWQFKNEYIWITYVISIIELKCIQRIFYLYTSSEYPIED